MLFGAHRLKPKYIAYGFAPVIMTGASLLGLILWDPSNLAPMLAGPLAAVISAGMAAYFGMLFASFTIDAQTKNAKVKAAFDMIFKKQWDKDYLGMRKLFIEMVSNEEDLKQYIYPGTPGDEAHQLKAEALRSIINDYELTAIAIKNHVIEGDVIKQWQRGGIISDMAAVAPVIAEVRRVNSNNRVWIEIEDLLHKWTRESPPKKPLPRWRLGNLWVALRRDTDHVPSEPSTHPVPSDNAT